MIAAEHARLYRLSRYDSMTAEAHEEWRRLHEEEEQAILRIDELGALAMRAGALAGAAVPTAELVRNVRAVVCGLHGWVGRWWDRYGDAYRAWRSGHWPPHPEGIVKSPGACTEMPPDFIENALPLLRPACDALSPLTNRLHDIAIAIPFPAPLSSGDPAALPVPQIDLETHAIALLTTHEDWSVAEIAQHLNVSRQAPYKWKRFCKFAEKLGRLKPRGPKDCALPRGHKSPDGRIEAYTDQDEDK